MKVSTCSSAQFINNFLDCIIKLAENMKWPIQCILMPLYPNFWLYGCAITSASWQNYLVKQILFESKILIFFINGDALMYCTIYMIEILNDPISWIWDQMLHKIQYNLCGDKMYNMWRQNFSNWKSQNLLVLRIPKQSLMFWRLLYGFSLIWFCQLNTENLVCGVSWEV